MNISIREDYNIHINKSPLAVDCPISEILQDVEELRSMQPLEVAPVIKLFHSHSPLIVDTDPAFTALDAPSPDVVRVPVVYRPGIDPAPMPNVVVLGPGVIIYEVYLDSSISSHIDDPLFVGYLGEKPLILEALRHAVEAIDEPPVTVTTTQVRNIPRIIANDLIVGIVHRRFSPGYYAEIGTLSFDKHNKQYRYAEYTGFLDQILKKSKKNDLFNQLKYSFQEAILTRVSEFEAIPPVIIYDAPSY